jgi:glutamate synthase domain-containing protein 3
MSTPQKDFDLTPEGGLRALNSWLHSNTSLTPLPKVRVLNPDGAHAIACGADAPFEIDVMGHAGYYVAGMNKHARVTVHGNASTGAAENMMSGEVRIKGFASTSAGASAHGGCLIIEGDASLRCGISLKGGDIVVGGNVGSFSAFMAQAGRLVICGDAGEALGDSIYEAVIYVRGKVASLGADARFEEMTPADLTALGALLAQAGFRHDPVEFRKVASARGLYHWNADANQEY